MDRPDISGVDPLFLLSGRSFRRYLPSFGSTRGDGRDQPDTGKAGTLPIKTHILKRWLIPLYLSEFQKHILVDISKPLFLIYQIKQILHKRA